MDRKRLSIRLLMVAASAAAALLLVEGFLQLVDPFDYAAVEEREIFCTTIYRQMDAIALIPMARATYLGTEAVINSMGMRNPETTVEKPDGVYRILAVGDSVAFGWGVHEHECAPRVLETLLNEENPFPGKRVEVINAAVPGWNVVEEVMFILDESARFEPDMILWVLCINDLPRDPRDTERTGGSVPHWLMHRIRTVRFAWVLYLTVFDKLPPTLEEYVAMIRRKDYDAACRVLRKGVDYCRKAGIDLKVYYPFHDEQMIGFFRDEGIRAASLDVRYDEYRTKYALHRYDSHPNAAFHHRLAEAIWDEIHRFSAAESSSND